MGTRGYNRGVTLAMRLLTSTHRLVHRVTGGRVGRTLVGAEVVWLTTTGRRSGVSRRVPVVTARGTTDGRTHFTVAGSRGGTERDPAWAANLRGHAERHEPARLEVDGDHIEVDVRELHGAERDAGYAEMVSVYKGFAGYERQTERTIPVFVLVDRAPRRTA